MEVCPKLNLLLIIKLIRKNVYLFSITKLRISLKMKHAFLRVICHGYNAVIYSNEQCTPQVIDAHPPNILTAAWVYIYINCDFCTPSLASVYTSH